MTKFYVYNVQLLPNTSEYDEVGVSGYKRLMAKMKELNKRHLRDSTVENYHYHLSGDQFLGFDDSISGVGIVTGNFKRYVKTNEVKSLNRKTTVYKNRTNQTTFSRSSLIPFAFDAKRHYLAIEGSDVLTPKRMIEALTQFFTPVAKAEFPNHQLHINVLSSPVTVEKILLEAIAYKSVDLKLTFQNGHATQSLLAELKDTKTQNLSLHASGGRDGRMSGLPNFMQEMVRAAALVGTLKMGYYVNGVNTKQNFNSEDTPLSFVVRRSVNDSDQSYFRRVLEKVDRHADELEKSLEDEGPAADEADETDEL